MKNKFKKFVSVLLVSIMLISLIPVLPTQVSAESDVIVGADFTGITMPLANPEYNGFISPIDPIPNDILPGDIVHINNANILTINWTQTGKYYVLDEDIHLKNEWTPINNFADNVFDGQGHSINNLYILEESRVGYAGLFGQITNKATIKNVAVNIGEYGITTSTNYYVYAYAGGLVGDVGGDITIKNCYATGNVSSTGDGRGYMLCAGGLIGAVSGKTDNGLLTIVDCYATSDVSVSHSGGGNIAGGCAGGLIGFVGRNQNNGTHTIENCYATGDVFASSSHAGGLIGYSGSAMYSDTHTIKNCYATGDVFYFSTFTISNASVGGLIGIVSSHNGTQTIENCYATGDVFASSSWGILAGGLVGHFGHSYSSGSATNTIKNCYATGDVSASNSRIGGLVGDTNSYYDGITITINNCYRLSTQTITGGTINSNGTPLTLKQMRTQSSFEEWDFDEVWAINPNINNGFPYLSSLGAEITEPLIGIDITDSFTDANFLAVVREIVGKPTGPIYDTDVAEIEILNIGFMEIESLSGIEYFTSLTALNCYGNQLTDINLSNNTTLTRLDCHNNKLSELNVSNNAALTYLSCSYNKLNELNISNNINLEIFDCGNNQLTSLNLSNNAVLTSLYCCYNNMASPNDVIGWQEIGLILNFNFWFYPQNTDVNDSLTFTVEKITARAGEIVEVPIMISNNGIDGRGIAAINDLRIQFEDTYIEWAGTATQSIINGGMLDYTTPQGSNFSNTHATIGFDSEFGTKADGTLITFKFKVKEDAPNDIIPLTLTVSNIGDDSLMVVTIPATEYNIVSGSITVIDVVYGDINNDTFINSTDVTLLRRYIAGWGVEINTRNADVNNDTFVNSTDVTLLRRFIAGWPVTLGPTIQPVQQIMPILGLISAMSEDLDKLTITVESATVNAGDTVDIPITITNNGIGDRGIGAINNLKIEFDDTYLEWIGTASQSIITGGMLEYTTPQGANFSSTHAIIGFDSEDGTKSNGTLVTLKFKVKDGAPADDIVLTLIVDSIGDDSLMVVTIPTTEYDIINGIITVVTPPTAPSITTTSLSDGTIGTSYSKTLEATGDTPITWSISSGSLPDGLNLISSTGEISGTPTTVGTFNFTVKANNGVSPDDTKELSIKINAVPVPPTITTTTLPDGIYGTAYSQTLTATGDAPIAWSIADGDLPAGLTLSETGVISGTPTAAGTFTFTVKANNGVSPDATKELSIKIDKVTLTPSINFVGTTNKTYDGNTTINGTSPTIALAGAVSGDSPAATASIAFADANVGNNKNVNATSIVLTGTWGNNYLLSATELNNVASGLNITKKDISINTVATLSKTYDGTMTATAGAVTFTGEVTGQELILNTDYTVTAEFTGNASAAAGTKNYTYTVTMLTTAKANNYNLGTVTKTGTDGTITKASYFGSTPTTNKTFRISAAGSMNVDLSEILPTLTSPMIFGNVTYAINGAATDANSLINGTPSISGNILTINYNNVGTAGWTATISIKINSDNYNDIEVTVTITTIDKEDVSGSITFNPGSATYNGSELNCTAATISGYSGGAWTYTYSANGGNAVLGTNNKPLNAGTYTVTAKYEDENNIGTAIETFTVNPKTLTAAMLSIPAATYNGSPQTPVLTVTDPDLGILTSGSDYTATLTARTDAGTYSVTVTGAGNYTGTPSVNFVINKKSLTGATITLAAGPYTYTGDGIEPNVTSVVVDGVTAGIADYTVGYSNNTGVGTTATVTVTATPDGNFSGNASTMFTIDKADQATLTVTDPGSKAYGDVPFQLLTTGGSGDGAVTYTRISGTAATVTSDGLVTITGVGDIVVTATKAADTNYNEITSATLTISIGKTHQAALTINTVAPQTYAEPNPTVTLSTSGGSGDGAVTYTVESGPGSVTGNTLTITGAGIIVITATKAGDDNYGSATSAELSITVNKANQAALTITGLSGPYVYGDAITLGTTGGSTNGTVTYTSNNTSVATVSGNTVNIVGVGSFAITATMSGNTNYNDVSVTSDSITVNKANQTTITITPPAAKTYGDAPFTLSTTGGSGTGAVTYTITSGSDVISISGNAVTIIKTGTATVTVDKAGDNNYNAATTSAPVTITVNKATTVGVNQTYEVMIENPKNYSFDLTSLLPHVNPLTLGTVTYSPVIMSNTDGILGTLSYTSGNILTIPVLDVTDINKTATITVTITSDNYIAFNAVITVKTIDKIPVTITATMNGGEYNGTAYAYSDMEITENVSGESLTGITPDVLYESTDSGVYNSSTAPTNAGAYKLTLSVPASDPVYSGSEVFTFTISQKAVTITANDKTIKVGDPEPDYTYTVTGLVTGENLITEPIVSCPAYIDAADEYDIIVSGADAGANYTITYANGTLTVNDLSDACDVIAVTTPSNATVSGLNITARTSGSNLTVNISASPYATWKLYSDPDCLNEITNKSMSLSVGANTAYIEVTAENGVTTKVYTLTITRASGGGGTVIPPSGGDTTPTNPTTTPEPTITPPTTTAPETTTTMATGDDNDKDKITELKDGSTVDTPDGQDPVENDDGSVTLPGGGIVTTPKGSDINVPAGAVISSDGKISFPEGSGGATITHENGYTFDIDEDAIIILDENVPLGYSILIDNPFEDVHENDWYFDNVMFAYNHGLMIGTSTEPMLFSPNASVTRGMVVTVLYRLSGSLDVAGLDNPFDDVTESSWYADAVIWAANNGIINGYGNGNFGPEDSIIRQDLAVILYNYEKYSGNIPFDILMDKEFADWNNISDYAKNAVNVLTMQGIINGRPGGIFDPKGQATRAEFAAMLQRFLEANGEGQLSAMAYSNSVIDLYIDKSALEAIEKSLMAANDDDDII